MLEVQFRPMSLRNDIAMVLTLLAGVPDFTWNTGDTGVLRSFHLFRNTEIGPFAQKNKHGQLPIQDAYVGSNRPPKGRPLMKPT